MLKIRTKKEFETAMRRLNFLGYKALGGTRTEKEDIESEILLAAIDEYCNSLYVKQVQKKKT